MRRFSKLLLLVAAVAVLSAASYAADSQNSLKLTIVHMNDCHGHYLPHKAKDIPEPIGGYPRAATVIKRIVEESRAKGRETLILHAGDLLTGTPFSMVWKGEMGVKLMNEMGFQAMAVGNHEFDHGRENLAEQLRGMMGFPLLSANITDDNGEYVFDRLVEKRFPPSETRVVIFGLTTETTPTATHPRNVKGLRFLKTVETARKLLHGYREEDLIIALTHLGVPDDKVLAEAVPKIDIIVGGHSHTALSIPLEVGKTLVVQAGAYATYVGRVDLDVEDGRVVKHEGRLIPLDGSIEDDKKVASIVEEYKAKMDARLQEVIGRTEVFLDGSLSRVRSGTNTNLGTLLTGIMAREVGADAAVLNGGAIRESLQEGAITLSDVYSVLPFEDCAVKLTMKGADLEAVLVRSQILPPQSGGKLQTFGISAEAKDGRVKITHVGGKVFDPEKTYSVATNEFLFAGGDGYSIFGEKGSLIYQTPPTIADMFIAFVKDKKVVTSELIIGM